MEGEAVGQITCDSPEGVDVEVGPDTGEMVQEDNEDSLGQ